MRFLLACGVRRSAFLVIALGKSAQAALMVFRLLVLLEHLVRRELLVLRGLSGLRVLREPLVLLVRQALVALRVQEWLWRHSLGIRREMDQLPCRT